MNHLGNSSYIWVGQGLYLPERHTFVNYHRVHGDHLLHTPMWGGRHEKKALAPVQTHIFLFADEVNPFTRKVVRKVGVPKRSLSLEEFERIMNPDKYGFDPIDPSSNVCIGRHVGQNMTNSRYLSASNRLLGTPRFPELTDSYWIDADKAKAAGVTFHENSAIQADIDRVIGKAKKAKADGLVKELERIKKLSAEVDREVLLEGHVPPSAIKGATAMGMTRGLQVVQGVGPALSVYDLGKAGQRSHQGAFGRADCERDGTASGRMGRSVGGSRNRRRGGRFAGHRDRAGSPPDWCDWIGNLRNGGIPRRELGGKKDGGTMSWFKRFRSEEEAPRSSLEDVELEQGEVRPPWVEYPGIPPGDFFWREAGEPWRAYIWQPYYEGLSEEEQTRYLERWKVPDDWHDLYFDKATREFWDHVDDPE